MNILFACSCLEPGRDGVGDYTRRLAGQLAASGQTTYLLALADPHIQEPLQFNSTLRLPASMPWPKRVRLAKEFVASKKPDWISWQIVLYGFDPRGLCFGLGARLKYIAGEVRNHVMFHEIWIGEAEGVPFKRRIIGKLQRHITVDLLAKLRPAMVHTHTPLYRHLLDEFYEPVRILPLFGNIPLQSKNPEWLGKHAPHGFQDTAGVHPEWLVFVLFGSIHPEWDGDEFYQKASTECAHLGRKVLFISIGRPGGAGEAILEKLRVHESETWRNLALGAASEADISQCLLAADIGVSPVPPEYLCKSGTAAAMLEHGLPVIVTRPAYKYRNCPPELLESGLKNVQSTFDFGHLAKTEPASQLPAVANQFLHDLSCA